MKHRRTLLIIQPGFLGLVIQRGYTTNLFTCPQAAAALGVSLRWVHRYVQSRRKGTLYQLGRPLLWRSEVVHLQRTLANRRRAAQRTVHPLVTRRKP
jgi:hypothetical protein